MLPSTASGVESCTVSSSRPIPARNKHDMQPSSPVDVSSSTPPQFRQVEICCEGGCIYFRLSYGHCRFQFQKCSQLFIRVHNETLSIAVRISNPLRKKFQACVKCRT